MTKVLFCHKKHKYLWIVVKSSCPSQVDDLWLYTESETEGVIMDPCKGDSGGPLVVKRGGELQLVGVLQVGWNSKQSDQN